MRRIPLLTLTVLLCVVGLTPGPVMTPAAAAEPDPFVGNAMCLRCHLGVHEKMADTPHGSEDFRILAEHGCGPVACGW